MPNGNGIITELEELVERTLPSNLKEYREALHDLAEAEVVADQDAMRWPHGR